jgi:hypothetical protein
MLLRKAYEHLEKPKCFYGKHTSIWKNRNASTESIRVFGKIEMLLRKAYEHLEKPKCFYGKHTSIWKNRNASTESVRAFGKIQVPLNDLFKYVGCFVCYFKALCVIMKQFIANKLHIVAENINYNLASIK